MQRQPRDPKAGIFADGMGFDVVLQGVTVSIITLLAFFVGHYFDPHAAGEGINLLGNSAHGTTMAFLALSMTEIFHSFNMRSLHKSIFKMGSQNKFLWGAMILSLVMTTVVLYVPFLRNAFDFTFISLWEYAIAMLLAVLIVPVVEIEKIFERRRMRKKGLDV